MRRIGDFAARLQPILNLCREIFPTVGSRDLLLAIVVVVTLFKDQFELEAYLKQGCTQISSHSWKIIAAPCSYDVFINHRGPDTKRNVAGLIYDRLVHLKLRPYLDTKCMSPGDKLDPSLEEAIHNCKIGIVIISPRYSESRYCLLELALLVEARKKIIPIFYDIQPSNLLKMNNARATPEEMARYMKALVEVRNTIGIVFDSKNEYACH